MAWWHPNQLLAPLLLALIPVATIGGLWGGVYRDNALVTRGWLGNDTITLCIAWPVMAGAWYRSRHGSRRAVLLWLGTVYFVSYNYAFYLFGAAFNSLFLVYASLLIAGAFSLIAGLRDLPLDGFPGQRLLGVASYLLLIGIMMGAVHLSAAVRYIWTGHLPDVVMATGHPTNVVAALDLGMVVAPSILGAIWIWQRKAWGYVLAVLVSVKGALYMAALTAAVASAVRSGALADGQEALLWAGLGIGCLVSTVRLLLCVH